MPEHIKEEDIERLVTLMREYPFGMLITVHEVVPAVVPFEPGADRISMRMDQVNV